MKSAVATTYDAYEERQCLAAELACWKEAEFFSPQRARRWHRRVRRLARASGCSADQAMADLEQDALLAGSHE